MVSCCTVRRIRWEITRNGLIVLRADQSFSEPEGRPVGVQSRCCVEMPVRSLSHVMFLISPFLRSTSPLMVGMIWASGQGVGTDGVCALFLPLFLSPFIRSSLPSIRLPIIVVLINQSPNQPPHISCGPFVDTAVTSRRKLPEQRSFPVAINQKKYLGCHIRQRSVLVGVGEKRRLQPLAGARKNRQFATFLEGE